MSKIEPLKITITPHPNGGFKLAEVPDTVELMNKINELIEAHNNKEKQ